MQDAQIVELYLKRDESAIDLTAKQYGNYCEKIAMNILNDLYDAEECVNDTYLNAWNSIPPNEPSNLATFLGKITRNLAIDRYRKKSSTKREGTEYNLLIEECEYLFPSNDSVSEEMDFKVLGEYISKFLHEQKEVPRKVFVLRYFYMESIANIAKKFFISEAKAKTMLFRTREKLKIYLTKEGIIK